MREDVTPERLAILMQALSASAPRGMEFRVCMVGGGTAILRGWRASSLDVDLAVDDDRVLRDIQRLKDELDINIELVEPTAFVPALQGAADRHVFIRKIKRVAWYHYDPYTQVLAKLVRGLERDLADARRFVEDGLVDMDTLQRLVDAVPDAAYARYPSLSKGAVRRAVEAFASTC
ncbi:MAG: hypothetical protein H6805_02735 [Planctomycetes bacterium]|nr:hypothetical protein [Planctomycetota bacterium]